MDLRDWLVIVLMVAIQVAATIFVFRYPQPLNFATWATVCGTLIGAYHWLIVKDSKQADAK